tara:strand:+ start:72 stop:326 length:255 start_codon:yes stop_codon:yes gene_type:complete
MKSNNNGIVVPFYPKKKKKLTNGNIALLLAININDIKDTSPEDMITDIIETFSNSTVLHSEYIDTDEIDDFDKIVLHHDNDNNK